MWRNSDTTLINRPKVLSTGMELTSQVLEWDAGKKTGHSLCSILAKELESNHEQTFKNLQNNRLSWS